MISAVTPPMTADARFPLPVRIASPFGFVDLD